MFARQFLAALLVLLLACPAWANPGIVGSTSASKATTVRGTELLPGSTVFHGDTIDVGRDGGAWIALEGGRIQIGPESQVRLLKQDNTIQFDVSRGQVIFRIQGGLLQGRLADATILAAGPQPAVGVITVTGRKALISAERGELLVAAATTAKSVKLREGEGVEVTLEPAPTPQAGNGANATTLSGKWVAVLGVVTAAIVTAVAIILNRGETNLTPTEKKNEVSPFRFP